MDYTTYLTEQNLETVSRAAGVPTKDVGTIATALLPLLLSSMNNNAQASTTGANSLMGALLNHANDDNNKVDAIDGGKILAHILGLNQQPATQQVAQKTGIDVATVAKIAAMLAPILLSSLGKKAQQQTTPAQQQMFTIAQPAAQQPASSGVNMLDVAALLFKLLK